jgi:WD40 repeat protein
MKINFRYNLKGHNGKVNSLCWLWDDSRLISAGHDGAVYEWNLKSSKRDGENIVKSCSYLCITVSQDGKSIFTVSTDKSVKEISQSQILRDFKLSISPTQVSFIY